MNDVVTLGRHNLDRHNNVNEPRSPHYSSAAKQSSRKKQITRILVHLRDQLHQHQPDLPMPSQWMLERLVVNAMRYVNLNTQTVNDWQSEVIGILKIINDASDGQSESLYVFFHEDDDKLLYSNHELFDELDTYQFSQALLNYLHSLQK